ncbi:ORF3 [Grizzly bear anellovirus 3]|nr:ORF3 [Grizzly bear anellovirus 3]
MNFFFRSEAGPTDSNVSPGPSVSMTFASPANRKKTPTATPVSILKKTSTDTGSSKKQALRELLRVLSAEKSVLWRSSPGLFSSNASGRRESVSPTKGTPSILASDTLSHASLSDIEPLPSSEDEEDDWTPFSDDEWEGGGTPPLYPPPTQMPYMTCCESLTKKGK